MAKETIRIAYCGEAVDTGMMDVRDLAPALLALGEVLEESNHILNGQDSKLKVLVKADMKRGSFEVNLEVLHTLSEQLKFITGFAVEVNIEELLSSVGLFCGITGFSLIDLIKRLKGKKPKSATIIENGNVRIEIPSNGNVPEYIEVSQKVVSLYRNIPVRQKISGVLKPLEEKGIDSFESRPLLDKTIPPVKITKEELAYFQPPSIEDTEVIETERRALLRIANLSFDESNKWRLDDGECKIWAVIHDHEFLAQVDSREIVFAKGDTLEVVLKTKQSITVSGLKTEHEVAKVIKVHPKPEQLPLFKIDE